MRNHIRRGACLLLVAALSVPLRAHSGRVPPPVEIVQCPASVWGNGRMEISNRPDSFV